MSRKEQHQATQANAPRKSANKPYIYGGVFVLILIAIYFVGRNLQTEKLEPVQQPSRQQSVKSAVAFTRQGYLRFLDQHDNLLSSVDIEIADNDAKRMQGLMYRDSMAENHAMLFIFEDEAERSFWMENTYFSLDIVYINAKNRIITVQKNTVPFSEDSIPSNGPAQYVVEVNAGYCDRHNIKPGDHIEWNRF